MLVGFLPSVVADTKYFTVIIFVGPLIYLNQKPTIGNELNAHANSVKIT